MPKYLIQATYSPEAAAGILKAGGTQRQKRVEELYKSVGGKVEAFYFEFGGSDALAIVDLPDNASAAAASMAVAASGAARLQTVVLLTPEEIDQAAKKKVRYTRPGE